LSYHQLFAIVILRNITAPYIEQRKARLIQKRGRRSNCTPLQRQQGKTFPDTGAGKCSPLNRPQLGIGRETDRGRNQTEIKSRRFNNLQRCRKGRTTKLSTPTESRVSHEKYPASKLKSLSPRKLVNAF
jgi:hypothetical protein